MQERADGSLLEHWQDDAYRTGGRICISIQDKSIGVVAPGTQSISKSLAGMRHQQPSGSATEGTSKQSHRIWLAGEQSREVAVDRAGGWMRAPASLGGVDGADLTVGSEDAHRQLCKGWGQEWK